MLPSGPFNPHRTYVNKLQHLDLRTLLDFQSSHDSTEKQTQIQSKSDLEQNIKSFAVFEPALHFKVGFQMGIFSPGSGFKFRLMFKSREFKTGLPFLTRGKVSNLGVSHLD